MKTSHSPHRVSLPRALSKLGLRSRSKAIEDIARGFVTVNGAIEKNPHRWVHLKNDRIAVRGVGATPKKERHLAFYKPAGVVTTMSDERGNQTVYELLGSRATGLIPVGRLDKDTSGLLLLTTDHKTADILTQPAHDVQKCYEVTVDRPLAKSHLDRLAQGVEIMIEGKSYKTKPARIQKRSSTQFTMTITEGKNRQIRKMLESVGFLVVALKRTSIGPINIGTLKPGQTRELAGEELESLRTFVDEARHRRKATASAE